MGGVLTLSSGEPYRKNTVFLTELSVIVTAPPLNFLIPSIKYLLHLWVKGDRRETELITLNGQLSLSTPREQGKATSGPWLGLQFFTHNDINRLRG